jgi:hypothetical protein
MHGDKFPLALCLYQLRIVTLALLQYIYKNTNGTSLQNMICNTPSPYNKHQKKVT